MFEGVADELVDDQSNGDCSADIHGNVIDGNHYFNLGLRDVVEPEELVDQLVEVYTNIYGSYVCD